MGALERVTRALAAMTPGPWEASDEYVWQVLDGGRRGHLIQGAGYEGEMRPEDAAGIATLRNDTAQALAEARAEAACERDPGPGVEGPRMEQPCRGAVSQTIEKITPPGVEG